MDKLGKAVLVPSNEEFARINELKTALKVHLVNCSSLSEPVRRALNEHASDETLLLRFIRGRKLDVDKAFDSIVRYAEIRWDIYPEVFPDEIPHSVRTIYDKRILSVFNEKDALGRTIVVFAAENWDASEISLEEIICAGRYLVDALIETSDFLTKGGILLCDCKGGSLSHAKQYTIPNILKFVNVFWKAYPIQIKGLYYVNAPFFVKPVFGVVKPFLPSKLKERVLITSGVTELHERVSPEILPAESFGGKLSIEEATSWSIIRHIERGNKLKT
ncbi:Retinaldehyde-binding protein 1 [Orchesella cincta]|uniref:Retinaldehyde-binding protein 1 n=1 Tax=Orchesella cincta TaxID=48709 RepID=A0A1D2N525_ORCCI|nr:Retinaldehyde-binding protein 1 [Orchesella cincta]